MKFSWHPSVPLLLSKSFAHQLLALTLVLSAFACSNEAMAGPELPIDDLQKQAASVAPHLSNLSLVQGLGRRRKANPLPYQPMQQYNAPSTNELGQHEAFEIALDRGGFCRNINSYTYLALTAPTSD
ncbi:MAG: hypothetical protein IPJ49_14470 [Candidatus Obscuribacter sp.]|nr:hypothetical protein [Candidatus Obscuribacter sp.]